VKLPHGADLVIEQTDRQAERTIRVRTRTVPLIVSFVLAVIGLAVPTGTASASELHPAGVVQVDAKASTVDLTVDSVPGPGLCLDSVKVPACVGPVMRAVLIKLHVFKARTATNQFLWRLWDDSCFHYNDPAPPDLFLWETTGDATISAVFESAHVVGCNYAVK